MEKIKEALKLVPDKPGCYQMKDADDKIIYVGKAKSLAKRLKSYFMGAHDAKTTKMVGDIDHFEYIVTSSETEAFLLELNFIKEHRPKYNIMLMDDKSYPYICLTNEVNPRVIVAREHGRIDKYKNGKLFGPYPNAKACHTTAEIINKLFPLRKCSTIPNKKCIYYDIGQCLAPCINEINPDVYNSYRKDISHFLSGNDLELIKTIQLKMKEASINMDFEKAIEYRDLLNNLQIVDEKQKMSLSDGINRDIFGYYVKDNYLGIQVFHMRYGRIVMRSGEIFDCFDDLGEVITTYIGQFYTTHRDNLPTEILVPNCIDTEMLSTALSMKVLAPLKGIKKKLIDLANENAFINIDNLIKQNEKKNLKTTIPLEELAKLLNINYPHKIEVFDNSNISGTSSVSTMVTYIDGLPSKNHYRKYKIKTVVGADDFHTMQEVGLRRYSKLAKENYPDLIIVDGGKPQVQAMKEILDHLGIQINLIGLAKDDFHKTNAIVTSDFKMIPLNPKTALFLLLENMQEEVHRFAITFFRTTHSKKMLASNLDTIKGIGLIRKKKLLDNYGSLDEIKEASDEQLNKLGLSKTIIDEIRKLR